MVLFMRGTECARDRRGSPRHNELPHLVRCHCRFDDRFRANLVFDRRLATRRGLIDPIRSCPCVATPLVTHLDHLEDEITQCDVEKARLAKIDPISNRFMPIPGIGPVTTTALAASVRDLSSFTGPRQFAGFLGLVPR